MTRPKVLDDLYGDLKDRKLLPIVALLAVAIVAVPIALSVSSSPPETTEAPVAEIVPADAPEAQAAVLAENPGLRNYRQRLDALKTKNPFDQQYAASELADAAASAGAPDAGAVSGTVPAGDATSAPGSESTGSVAGSTGGSVDSTTIDTTVDETTDSVNIDVTPSKPQFYTYRLDLSYGVDGDVKKHKNVKTLDILSPVGAFLGASENGDRAYFTLSSDVVGVNGEGQCAPSSTDCEFLGLKQGEATSLIYQPATAPAPTTYRLAIDKIRLVKVKKPQGIGE